MPLIFALVTKAKQWQEEFALSVTLAPEMAIQTLPKAESLVNQLIEIRKGLRVVKQWQLADIIRNGLSDLGIILEDTPKGTTWHRSR